MSADEHPTCWQLIRRAAEGAVPDREEFARRYLPTVRDYLRARWQGSPLAGEIEDAAQEVFVALLRSGGVLERADPDHGSGFRGLLYGVTRNVALHTERTRARRVKRVAVDAEVEVDRTAAEDPTLSVLFDRSYAESVVRQARNVMAADAETKGAEAKRRLDLLRLVFQDGLPIRQIATQWGVDAAELHREHAKARKEFRGAIATVVAGTEGCSGERLERECARLLELLKR